MNYLYSVVDAFSELPFGGGKAVIMKSSSSDENRGALMRAYGRIVTRLRGRYFTAEDVGTSCEDMEDVSKETKYIFGLSGTSGDPSPHTALGVFLGIQASVEERFGIDSLAGLRVVVQGVGNVGYHLCALLHRHGASLLVSDLDRRALARCEQEFGATIVDPDACYDCDAEVYAPCALGATVGPQTLERLKVGVIAGSANNQLQDDSMASLIGEKGILYAPDYLINAGGIVNIACEMDGGYCADRAHQEVSKIGARIRQLFARSRQEGVDTLAIANRMARERFERCPGVGGGVSILSPVHPGTMLV